MANSEMMIDDVVLSAEEEARIDEAIRNARDPNDDAVALSARYDPLNDLLILQLKSGRRIAIPCEDLQGLSTASADELAKIEIVGPGTALHWPQLQEAFPVSALAQGIYGSEKWMDGLAARRKEIRNVRLAPDLLRVG